MTACLDMGCRLGYKPCMVTRPGVFCVFCGLRFLRFVFCPGQHRAKATRAAQRGRIQQPVCDGHIK